MRHSVIVSVALLLAAPSAHAGEAEAAEHVRLREELVALVSRSAWSGAAETYQQMIALEAKGETLDRAELWLGAQIAQALGDVAVCRARLERAQDVEPTLDGARWLRSLDASFGPVSLVARTPAEAVLVAVEPPFEPERRTALDLARARLAAEGRFDGLLPRGAYTFGSASFSVDPTVAVVTVDLTAVAPPVEAPVAATAEPRSRVGPRFVFGGAWSAALAPTTDDRAQPPAFAGAGARVAGGLELAVSPTLGLWAQAGYHGLVAASESGARPDALHLGFLSAGPALHAGAVRLAVGGVLGAGLLQASGIHDLEGLATACPQGSDAPDCAWIAPVPEQDRARYLWTGSVVTPGVEGSLGVRLATLGPRLGAGLTVGGGVLVDPSRMYPFGLVGVEIGGRAHTGGREPGNSPTSSVSPGR